MQKRFISISLLSFLLLAQTLFAARITGKVVDQYNSSVLVGANLIIMETRIGAATNIDGEFVIANLSPGTYTLAVSYIGYKVSKQKITIGTRDITLNIEMVPLVLKGQEIIVSATRAIDRETPVAFTDISAKDIEQKYWAQEVPLLLNEVPGVYSYSNTGGAIGYSEVKIRGFDATRVGVTVNNVPLNDPEDHVTYFYDLPDISANLQDIQVQRGVANSLYGTGAFAGSVNLQTGSAGEKRYINYTGGMGSYNTRKHTFSLGSGLVNNTYSFYGRFSKVNTDGYRDNSWVDSWSYFFSAARYDEKISTKINVFGGPMRAHFAWEGITREELQTNRKLNYYTYKNAADNFNQPHYQLINEWTPNEHVKLTSTLFHVKGDGYYEQFKAHRKLQEYNMTPFEDNGELVQKTDLVRQKWVDKKQYGWIPQLQIKYKRHKIFIGSELSLYNAHHWGQVVWGAHLPPGTAPQLRYYEHNTEKNSAAFYANDVFHVSEKLFVKADLQFQHLTYKFKQTKLGAFFGHQYDLNYNFLTPRIGVNYNLNKKLNIFGNYSIAKREPKDSDIYDADNPDVLPLFRVIDPARGIYKDPYVKPETLYDMEAGLGYQKTGTKLRLNVFYMNFDNEIVPTGGITDDGYPIYGNAEKSVHRGIELDLHTEFPLGLLLSSNATYSDNYFIKYTEYFWNQDWTGNVSYNRNGNKIGGFPNLMFNFRLSKTLGPIFASAHFQHIGRIFLDNAQQNELSITPHNVVNFSARMNLPKWFGPVKLSLNLFVNNVLNKKYELSGYTWDGVGYYIPAAERNYYLSIQTEM
ncbi:MAG: TonB-dependent receptor [Actinobacteria bacterium]|nr:TonB-dependent receptor [Actinomycetota bacterium]